MTFYLQLWYTWWGLRAEPNSIMQHLPLMPVACLSAHAQQPLDSKCTFFLKLFQDPLIWFKVLAVYFCFTWGFYFLDDCYRSSKVLRHGPPWALLAGAAKKTQSVQHAQGAITAGSNLSAPERASDTNMKKQSRGYAKKKKKRKNARVSRAFGKVNKLRRAKKLSTRSILRTTVPST